MKNRIIIFLSCFIFAGCCLFAQEIERGLIIDKYAVEYLQIADNQSVLYYGNQQEGHLPRALNHPYLNETQFVKGRLSYNKIIYPDELLGLDLSRDELVVISPDNDRIVLFSDIVDFAELQGQLIIYFCHDSLPGSPASGYYTLLYSEKCRVMKKQSAILVKATGSSSKLEQEYMINTTFFLYKDGVYYAIRTKGGLLKTLQPFRKELKRFMTANKLSFRKHTDEFLISIISEYEKLSGH